MRFIKISWSVIFSLNQDFFYPEISRDDGTAQLSVGELRQGKRNLFPFLFCLFRQTIEKSSVNNKIIALRFFFGLSENPVQKPEKPSATPPVAAGIFFAKITTLFLWIRRFFFV